MRHGVESVFFSWELIFFSSEGTVLKKDESTSGLFNRGVALDWSFEKHCNGELLHLKKTLKNSMNCCNQCIGSYSVKSYFEEN